MSWSDILLSILCVLLFIIFHSVSSPFSLRKNPTKMVENINWMADRSEKGLTAKCRLENIEEYARSYFSTGHIHTSSDIRHYVESH
ncbi:hypothetical protein SLEP1_g14472 [Rubroshorea leprosula]|uniref:Uncharacterized protein n=1 Tax=Rubroshorea leprosula TaxID=152421 RepID=A0AAV5IVQ1_9ROSI|nr:hypothetical protein SLEP1_g14472 [Rubroshorea leprosula]